jgi:hypothetical protein
MAGRQNREARVYGAPTSPPKVDTSASDAQRARLLNTRPSAEERRRRIEARVREGQEETRRTREAAQRESGTRTEAPKPPIRQVGQEGRSTRETLRTRGRDLNEAVEEAGG